MALVSIIVPVYNAGHRLYKLLDSLCHQTLKDIEIICVLDAPTDGSDELVLSYSKNDRRIIPLINTTTIGISASRNRGIEEAIRRKSLYIGFADHDDYLEISAYYSMYESANISKADVVFANTIIEHPDNKSIKIPFKDPSWEGMIKSLLLPMVSNSNPNYLCRSVWNAIYKTEFIVSKDLYFRDRDTYYEEDTLFNLEVYANTKNIIYLDEYVYHWVKYEQSTSNITGSLELETERILCFLIYEWQVLSKNALLQQKKFFYVMVSYFLRRYYSVILRKNDTYKIKLAELLSDCKFPIVGRYENMKLLSKIRLKLLVFVLRLKISYLVVYLPILWRK